jgi:hypothetical protein
MIGFRLVNLLIPGTQNELRITTNNGEWTLVQEQQYDKLAQELQNRVSCAETYFVTHNKMTDDVFDELLYICLAASFLSGSAVTVSRSLPSSEIKIAERGPRYPRDRGLSIIGPIYSQPSDFEIALSTMVDGFESAISNNIEVIIHHWLDSLSCWSLEDQYLSACTILEMVKQNERRRNGNQKQYFYDAIVSASNHYQIRIMSRDWISMRNDLVHDGKLSGSRFQNKDVFQCNAVSKDVLHWLDEYIFAVFGIAGLSTNRYNDTTLLLNSYTVY